MAHSLDLNGMLVSALGEKIPCKLVHIGDDGLLEIYSIDPVAVDTRLQLIIASPRLQSAIRIKSAEQAGDTYRLLAAPEEGVAQIQAKIIEQKVRGLIR